jgi:hypothetical protein
MHNLFIYDAKEWFFTNIAEGTTYIIRGYDEAVEKLKAKYQSVTRQDRIKQVLYCLTFEEFVEGSGTHSELKTALDKTSSRQELPDLRNSVHRRLKAQIISWHTCDAQ